MNIESRLGTFDGDVVAGCVARILKIEREGEQYTWKVEMCQRTRPKSRSM